MKNGGVAIFIHQSLQYVPINLEEFCMDQTVFLQVGSFYSLDKYYEWKTRDDCVNYK
jgi:hypothetical protein